VSDPLERATAREAAGAPAPLSVADDPAWVDMRRRFADVYDESNYAEGLQGFVMRAGHRLSERRFGPSTRFDRVLEVGAGTGVHLQFVRHAYSEYHVTDLDPKALDVARGRAAALKRGGTRVFETRSAAELDYPDQSFDRLVATHVLEHLYHPHAVLREWRRVVRTGGVITVLLPTDPGFAWRLGRRLGPRRRARRLGFDYDYVMAREHVNPLNNLIAFLRHDFCERVESWWPFGVPSMDLNLFFVCHAVVDRR
jgi:SAM-dependent methyltransferase